MITLLPQVPRRNTAGLLCRIGMGCLAAAAIGAGPVPAQTAPGSASSLSNDPDALQEVIVTAQFRKERVQDTPIAITALSSQELQQTGATDLAAAGNLAPNVSLTLGSSQGPFGQMASIFIRGVGQSDPHFAVEPGVGVYVDDVYFGVTPGNIFQLLDTDRVEISRGPQGTLSGKNSVGGSIKLYSNQPGPDSNSSVEAFYGSYDKIGGRAASNFTLIDGVLYARVAFAAVRRDGYMERLDYGCVTGTSPTSRIGNSCELGTQGGQDTTVGRASLRWIISSGMEDTVIADVIADNSENPAEKQLYASPLWAGTNNYLTCATCYTNYAAYVSRPVSGPSAGSPFNMPATTPLNGWGAENRFHGDISESVRFDSITAERASTVVFSAPGTETPASVVDQIWRLADMQFTQELRLTGEFEHLFDWTVGAFYYDARGTSGGRVNIPFGLSPGGGDGGLPIADDILFNDPVRTKNASAFAHTTWHLIDSLDLTADMRYSHDSKEFTFNRYDSLGEPNPAIPGLINYPVSFRGNRVDYRTGLDYKWSSDFMTYAQVSTGYKGGGVNPRPFFTSQAITYNPETLTAYEVGLKSEWLDRHVTVNLAGFYDKYNDFQGTLTSCDAYSPFPGAPCAMTANVGDAHISGVELETQARIIGGLSADASAGWLKFKYTSVNPNSGIALSDTNVFTPDFTANVGLQYALPMGGAGTVTPRLDLSYRADMYSSFVNAPENRVPAVGLLNGHLTWMDARNVWSATFTVTNLLNRFYYQTISDPDAPPPALQLYGTILGTVGPPRMFTFSVHRTL